MATVGVPSESIESGKLFVGGLSWDTNKDKLCEYFQTFGEVKDSVVMNDPVTKKPRGFGFVVFADESSVHKVLAQPEHILDGKKIDPKQATVKGNQQVTPGATKKIFLGGIHVESTRESIAAFFTENYAPVSADDVDLKYDKATNRMRGFCFVEFQSEEIVDNIVTKHYHTIDGKQVEAKRAEPRGGGGSSSYDRVPAGQQYGGVHQGGQYANGYGQSTAQHYQAGGYPGYSQGVYSGFPPQYYPQQYRQYSGTQNYGSNYASGNQYRGGFDNTAYSGGQQTSGAAAAAGQMYGQVDQASYPTTGRSGYSSATDGYSSQSAYGYESYPQSYQQQDTTQRGAGSYGRGGTQPQQQSSYYSASR